MFKTAVRLPERQSKELGLCASISGSLVARSESDSLLAVSGFHLT